MTANGHVILFVAEFTISQTVLLFHLPAVILLTFTATAFIRIQHVGR